MSLIWTRAAADWEDDRPLLAGVADLVRVPCVRIAGKLHDTKQFDVYVVLSPHALAHYALPPGAVVHTFGEKTAAAAARAGAKVQRHDVRSAAELVPILLKLLDKSFKIGLPGAAEPAFDLAGALRADGLRAEAVACYRTLSGAMSHEGEAFTAAAAHELAKTWRGVVCFASPSAVTGFLATFPKTELGAVCIGPTTGKAAAGHFIRVDVAPENSLAALVAAALAGAE